MSINGDILLELVERDFGLEGKGRWFRSVTHSSLVIDKEKGIFYWNAREIAGDPLIYLTKVRGFSFPDAREYLRKYTGYESTFVYTIKDTEPQHDIIVYPELISAFHESNCFPDRRDYWYRRGINDSTIDRFQLGWYNGYGMIPIFVDGLFRNFQMRKDKPERSIKMYYKGVGPLLFNSDVTRVSNIVYITEGLTDCLRLAQEGIPAVCGTTGATGWQNSWFKYLYTQKEIYVVFDADDAGYRGIKKVAENLGMFRTHLYTFKGYDEKYDIVQFFRDGGTKDQLLNLVESESKYLFELE